MIGLRIYQFDPVLDIMQRVKGEGQADEIDDQCHRQAETVREQI